MEKKIIEILRKYKYFVVSMHVNPDADALGAALAMTLFLKSRHKKVQLLNEGPCPAWLKFMPHSSLYEKYDEKVISYPEVLIVLDCGDLDRIGKVKAVIGKNTRIINIDHHETNVRFGHYNHVSPQLSSTSELLYGLLKKARYRFTEEMAKLLYLGILTDTGSFAFDCTSAHTHLIVAELMKYKFSVSGMYREVYEIMPKKDLQPFLRFMNQMQLECNERVACLEVTQSDELLFSKDFDLKDKVFTFLRGVAGLDVIVIFAEKEGGRIRVNFRSRGNFNVASLAEKFKGGGHRNASGCFLTGSLNEVRTKILSELKKRLS